MVGDVHLTFMEGVSVLSTMYCNNKGSLLKEDFVHFLFVCNNTRSKKEGKAGNDFLEVIISDFSTAILFISKCL